MLISASCLLLKLEMPQTILPNCKPLEWLRILLGLHLIKDSFFEDGGILIDFSVSPPKNGNATFQSDSSVMSTKQPADSATTGNFQTSIQIIIKTK